MTKKTSLKIFKNGAIARIRNRSIQIEEHEGETRILFSFCEKDAHIPACSHKCDKGKVRRTFINMSDEAMEVLVHSWLRLKHHQQTIKLKTND